MLRHKLTYQNKNDSYSEDSISNTVYVPYLEVGICSHLYFYQYKY